MGNYFCNFAEQTGCAHQSTIIRIMYVIINVISFAQRKFIFAVGIGNLIYIVRVLRIKNC